MTTVLRKKDILGNLKLQGHPLNPAVARHALSLGDQTGLSKCGVHFTVLKPGALSTERHVHHVGDEFIYVLSGRGVLQLDEETLEIAAGDFVGLPARGPSHALQNPFDEELVYLVGGDRPAFDRCDYPELGKRVYFYMSGDRRMKDFVEDAHVDAR